MGPRVACSSVLSTKQKATIVTVVRQSHAPCHWMTVSVCATSHDFVSEPIGPLHHCLLCHDVNPLPVMETDHLNKKNVQSYLIGFFHADIAEVRTKEGKLCLFITIDRTAYAEFHDKSISQTASRFCTY